MSQLPAQPRSGRLPRVLHLATAEKFLPPFIAMVRREFPHQSHEFRIFKKPQPDAVWPVDRGVRFVRLHRLGDFIGLILDLHRADKILLHGLFVKGLNLLLLAMPWLLRKCHWAIWGGDLYAHQAKKRDWHWRKNEFVRQHLIPRLGYLVTYIPGDVQLARRWYGARGRHLPCLLYASNTYKPVVVRDSSAGGPTLLIGNSATPTNHHREIFERLAKLERQDFALICPLSYGSRAYGEEIAAEGRQRFGARFTPLLDFMPYEAYLDLLGTVTIAVFDHDRQQAMGNTIALLGLGKTVYARPELTSTAYLTALGITVMPINHLGLETLPAVAAARNCRLIRQHFSYDLLVRQCRHIFTAA